MRKKEREKERKSKNEKERRKEKEEKRKSKNGHLSTKFWAWVFFCTRLASSKRASRASNRAWR